MQRVHIEHVGDSIELPPGETLVGRDVSCALRFNDPSISRRHLRFIRRAHQVFVEDLGSSNGTTVNGKPAAVPVRLFDGDTIAIGGRVVSVRIYDSEDELEASTLVLKDLRFGADVRIEAMPRAVTAPMQAVTIPPPFANQRCPRCSAPVSELDEQCANCNHEWGGFRAATPTLNRTQAVTDLRRHERHTIELPLVYSSSELEIEAVSLDLSESGVFVCSQVLEPVGTECVLTILVDGGPPIKARGIVRRVVDRPERSQPIGLGVEFIGLGELEAVWIRTQVRRLESDGE